MPSTVSEVQCLNRHFSLFSRRTMYNIETDCKRGYITHDSCTRGFLTLDRLHTCPTGIEVCLQKSLVFHGIMLPWEDCLLAENLKICTKVMAFGFSRRVKYSSPSITGTTVLQYHGKMIVGKLDCSYFTMNNYLMEASVPATTAWAQELGWEFSSSKGSQALMEILQKLQTALSSSTR